MQVDVGEQGGRHYAVVAWAAWCLESATSGSTVWERLSCESPRADGGNHRAPLESPQTAVTELAARATRTPASDRVLLLGRMGKMRLLLNAGNLDY